MINENIDIVKKSVEEVVSRYKSNVMKAFEKNVKEML